VSSPRSRLLRRNRRIASAPRRRRSRDGAPMPATASQPLSAQIGKGRTRDEAVNDIAWSDGDMLVIGSSSQMPVSLVLPRSRATKMRATALRPSSFHAVKSRIRQRANP